MKTTSRTSRTGKALTSVHGFKPTRDIRVRPKSVHCPTCEAEIDFDCVKADGSPYAGSGHPARRRMAVRAHNVARGL